MSHAVESSEDDLDRRIHELIERGLALYGGGDLEGAMSAWRHALALDCDNRRAADYVAYVKRHFDISDEQALEEATFAPADVELEIPFGLMSEAPHASSGIEAYESFEVSVTPVRGLDNPVAEFEEEVPTRVRSGLASAQDIDEGWSIEGDEHTSGGFGNPLITSRTVRETGRQAALDLEPGAEELDAENGSIEAELAEEIESLSAGLGALELDGPDEAADDDDFLELALQPPRSREGRKTHKHPSGAEKSTLLGLPKPPAPAAELELDLGRATAEISPIELGEALSALSLDADLPSKPRRADSLSDVEFDLGDPSAEQKAEFDSKPYASVAIVGEDAGKIGDAMISFREPGEAGRSGLVEVEPAGGDLEIQLAELESELSTGSRDVAWTRHASSGKREVPAGLAASGPELAPLEPRRPRPSAGPRDRTQRASAPPTGLDAVRAAIGSAVDAIAPASESGSDKTRRRIAGFMAYAENELGRGELSTAAVAADMALAESPESALGQKLIHERSELFVSVFRKFLGDQSGVVAVALPLHELAKYELDHRTAFLLSRVDGTLTIEDVLDVSGMARLEAYRCLTRLVLQGVLEVR